MRYSFLGLVGFRVFGCVGFKNLVFRWYVQRSMVSKGVFFYGSARSAVHEGLMRIYEGPCFLGFTMVGL